MTRAKAVAGRPRRRVLRRRCPREGQIGVPVADSGRGLAREHARGTRKPLGHSAGRCGAGRGILADMGGSAAVESAGERGRGT